MQEHVETFTILGAKPPKVCKILSMMCTLAFSNPKFIRKATRTAINILPIRKPTTIDDLPVIEFSIEEEKTLSEKFKYALVGKFSRGLPVFKEIHPALSKLGLKGAFTVGALKPGYVLINPSLEEDFARLWVKHDWFIAGRSMRLFKCTPAFTYAKELAIAAVWMNIPDLPLHLFTKGALYSIASVVGNPVKIDEPTANQTRPSIARICVEIDLLQPPVSQLRIKSGNNSYVRNVFFEDKPLFCNLCFHRGHQPTSCFSNGHNPPPPKNKNEPATNEPNNPNKTYTPKQNTITPNNTKTVTLTQHQIADNHSNTTQKNPEHSQHQKLTKPHNHSRKQTSIKFKQKTKKKVIFCPKQRPSTLLPTQQPTTELTPLHNTIAETQVHKGRKSEKQPLSASSSATPETAECSTQPWPNVQILVSPPAVNVEVCETSSRAPTFPQAVTGEVGETSKLAPEKDVSFEDPSVMETENGSTKGLSENRIPTMSKSANPCPTTELGVLEMETEHTCCNPKISANMKRSTSEEMKIPKFQIVKLRRETLKEKRSLTPLPHGEGKSSQETMPGPYLDTSHSLNKKQNIFSNGCGPKMHINGIVEDEPHSLKHFIPSPKQNLPPNDTSNKRPNNYPRPGPPTTTSKPTDQEESQPSPLSTQIQPLKSPNAEPIIPQPKLKTKTKKITLPSQPKTLLQPQPKTHAFAEKEAHQKHSQTAHLQPSLYRLGCPVHNPVSISVSHQIHHTYEYSVTAK